LLCLTVLAAAACLRADVPPKSFSNPDRIRYDSQCFTIDGKDVFVFSGTFHYFRCPKPLWRERFRKIVEAGCNTVETYVPWDLYEQRPPASPADFSQVELADLKDWMRMAQDEFGLYTIIRPGPYICAEWDGGGFPRWLLTKRPVGYDSGPQLSGPAPVSEQPGALGQAGLAPQPAARRKPWLRTDDPVFLAWSRHWIEAVCRVVAAEQVSRKPAGRAGMILFQIENEYDLYKDIPEAQRAPHLRALYEASVQGGIDVPIFTCWTRQCRDSSDPELSRVFDAFNAYPRFKIDGTGKQIAELQARQPDAPVMISELQGGWFGKVGGLLSEDQPGLTPEQINAHTLLAIEKGATVLNYYVIFGGTNFGLWAGRDLVSSYDYYAPIRESGGVGKKYLAVAAIGRMLREHGAALARSRPLDCQSETGSADVTIAARRSRDGATYFFVRNHSVGESRKGSAVVWFDHSGETQIGYDLGPMGYRILRLPPGGTDPKLGEWLPKPVAGPMRPTTLPAPVRPAKAQVCADPGSADSVSVPAGTLLPDLGVFDARTVVYGTSVSLTAAEAASAGVLRCETLAGDEVAADVNGHIVSTNKSGEAEVGPWLKVGANSIRVLYVQAGQANFGREIEDFSGLRSAALGSRSPDFRMLVPLSGWTLAREWAGVVSGWPEAGPGEKSEWKTVNLDSQRTVPRKGKLDDTPSGEADSLAVWYRVEFKLPASPAGEWIPWRALVDAAGDGLVYLNGHALGRYWEQGPQREYYLPECWMRFGDGAPNVLTFCLSPMKKGVVLRAVEISPYDDQAEVRATDPTRRL